MASCGWCHAGGLGIAAHLLQDTSFITHFSRKESWPQSSQPTEAIPKSLRTAQRMPGVFCFQEQRLLEPAFSYPGCFPNKLLPKVFGMNLGKSQAKGLPLPAKLPPSHQYKTGFPCLRQLLWSPHTCTHWNEKSSSFMSGVSRTNWKLMK